MQLGVTGEYLVTTLSEWCINWNNIFRHKQFLFYYSSLTPQTHRKHTSAWCQVGTGQLFQTDVSVTCLNLWKIGGKKNPNNTYVIAKPQPHKLQKPTLRELFMPVGHGVAAILSVLVSWVKLRCCLSHEVPEPMTCSSWFLISAISPKKSWSPSSSSLSQLNLHHPWRETCWICVISLYN